MSSSYALKLSSRFRSFLFVTPDFRAVSSFLFPSPRTPHLFCYLLPALARNGNSKFMVDSPGQLHESIVLRIPCDPQPASDTNANSRVGEAEVLEPEAKGRRRGRELAHFTAGERGDRAVGRIPQVVHLPKAGERTLRRGVEGGRRAERAHVGLAQGGVVELPLADASEAVVLDDIALDGAFRDPDVGDAVPRQGLLQS